MKTTEADDIELVVYRGAGSDTPQWTKLQPWLRHIIDTATSNRRNVRVRCSIFLYSLILTSTSLATKAISFKQGSMRGHIMHVFSVLLNHSPGIWTSQRRYESITG